MPDENLLPDMETCYNCHDEDDTECTVCHTNGDEAAEVRRIVDMAAQFSHQTHIEEGQECISCHGGIDEKNKLTEGLHIPDRTVCIECHGSADYSQEKGKCLTCHNSTQAVKPADHLADGIGNFGARLIPPLLRSIPDLSPLTILSATSIDNAGDSSFRGI